MKLEGLLEIIIYVENMNALVRFYRDRLGLKLTHPMDIQDFSQEMWVTFDTGACTLALHGGGKRKLGDDTAKFVFAVKDIQKARLELLIQGVDLDVVREASPGILVVDGKDPEGHPFSLEEHI
jgi:catechol 2,3-dioxygenase-like lactoylglutathione lyase family enzyme